MSTVIQKHSDKKVGISSTLYDPRINAARENINHRIQIMVDTLRKKKTSKLVFHIL